VSSVQLAVVDHADVAGPPSHAVAAVEGWAQTIAAASTRRSYRAAVLALLTEPRCDHSEDRGRVARYAGRSKPRPRDRAPADRGGARVRRLVGEDGRPAG